MKKKLVPLTKKIKGISIINDVGLEVVFSDLGASIYQIKYNNEIMTLTPKNFKDFVRDDIYYGKTIGPVANRIKDGLVTINDKTYQMEKNEGNNTLHSGELGLSNRVFAHKIQKKKNYFIISFTCSNKHLKDGGLPGNIKFNVVYAIKKDEPILHVSFFASSDEDTLIHMTNHSYFCLGDKNIDNLYLTIPADKFIETNKEDLIPLSEKEIKRCLDFNNKKKIIQDINDKYLQKHRAKGYDHHFIFNTDSPIITLENDRYKLEIETDFSGVQIYSENYPVDFETLTSEQKIRQGVAIEPQDSILNRIITRKKPGYYSKFISYKFSQK